jgi:hypothetical protein
MTTIGGSDWNSAEPGPGIDMEMSVVLHESSEFYVRASRVRVHENSITLHLDGRGRGTWPGRNAMRERKDDIRITVRFADERTARLLDSAGLKSGLGPMVTLGGGIWRGRDPSRDEDFDLILTIWPLPPPGPLVIDFAWPEVGIAHSEVLIDGQKAQDLGHSLRGNAHTPDAGSSTSTAAVPPPGQVAVPLVVGMEVHSARSLALLNSLYLEGSNPDDRPLASGVIVSQEPHAGTVVEPFSAIRAQVWGDREDPPPLYGPDDSGGAPPGGVREPRRPGPGGNEGLAEASP